MVAACLCRRYVQSSRSACVLFTPAVGTFQKGAGNDWKNKSFFGGTKEMLTFWSLLFLLFVYTAVWWEQIDCVG